MAFHLLRGGAEGRTGLRRNEELCFEHLKFEMLPDKQEVWGGSEIYMTPSAGGEMAGCVSSGVFCVWLVVNAIGQDEIIWEVSVERGGPSTEPWWLQVGTQGGINKENWDGAASEGGEEQREMVSQMAREEHVSWKGEYQTLRCWVSWRKGGVRDLNPGFQ